MHTFACTVLMYCKYGAFLIGLPRVLQQKFRRIIDKKAGKTIKRKERAEDDDTEMMSQPLRKKKKLVGVLREKFYPHE